MTVKPTARTEPTHRSKASTSCVAHPASKRNLKEGKRGDIYADG